MMSYQITTMSTEEIRNRIEELSKILESDCTTDDWKIAYNEYAKLNVELDLRYVEENEDDFKRFYEQNIKGKTWEEIDPDLWDYYSDWHKDMYGYRPRTI